MNNAKISINICLIYQVPRYKRYFICSLWCVIRSAETQSYQQTESHSQLCYSLSESESESVTLDAGIILCMRPPNERRRYNVTSSLNSWNIHKLIPVDGILTVDQLTPFITGIEVTTVIAALEWGKHI